MGCLPTVEYKGRMISVKPVVSLRKDGTIIDPEYLIKSIFEVQQQQLAVLSQQLAVLKQIRRLLKKGKDDDDDENEQLTVTVSPDKLPNTKKETVPKNSHKQSNA